jgi:RNA polymerase sigma-70 factor (ECF subfamily)
MTTVLPFTQREQRCGRGLRYGRTRFTTCRALIFAAGSLCADDDGWVAKWADQCTFEDVLASARGGDELAFTKLWRWLNPVLLRWLRVVALESVEDVASEVWLSITRGLGSFTGGEDEFRGWVFTIARRRAIDSARHRLRQPRLYSLDGLDVPDVTTDVSRVEAACELDTALTLLRRLTPDQREVVALRVIADMTVSDTAAIVNRTEGAVRVLCHRGLRSLAQQLDGEFVSGGVTA